MNDRSIQQPRGFNGLDDNSDLRNYRAPQQQQQYSEVDENQYQRGVKRITDEAAERMMGYQREREGKLAEMQMLAYQQ